jgi:hypothetical protein
MTVVVIPRPITVPFPFTRTVVPERSLPVVETAYAPWRVPPRRRRAGHDGNGKIRVGAVQWDECNGEELFKKRTWRIGGEVLRRDQIVVCHVTPPPCRFPHPVLWRVVLLPERTLAGRVPVSTRWMA